jgi:hypothetical protein
VGLVVALAGCGGLSKQQRTANTEAARRMKPGTVMTDAQLATLDQDRTVVCETESGTGSHIPHKVCRTLRQQHDQANASQTSLSQMPSGYNAQVSGVTVGGT